MIMGKWGVFMPCGTVSFGDITTEIGAGYGIAHCHVIFAGLLVTGLMLNN